MIRALGLKEVAAFIQLHKKLNVEVLNAEKLNSDVTFTQVNTDTRSLVAGELFVALRGERFDAHDFIQDAANKNPVEALRTE